MTYSRAGYIASKFLAVIVLLTLLRVAFVIPTILAGSPFSSDAGIRPHLFRDYLELGIFGISFASLVYAALTLWFRAKAFAPKEPQVQAQPLSEEFLESLAFRVLGTYFIVSGLDEILSQAPRYIVLGLLANLIGPVFSIMVGGALFFRGRTRDARAGGQSRESIFKRSANWLWNPPLDDDEDEQQGTQE